jgi:uncharacterized protein YueI
MIESLLCITMFSIYYPYINAAKNDPVMYAVGTNINIDAPLKNIIVVNMAKSVPIEKASIFLNDNTHFTYLSNHFMIIP